ncbi:hypothetical protein Pcinc_043114 [Petrolisthes cinctipes]|uniref:Uncharacterized protein n=1 Tax=Petrolisthes cinctipes TaxID=88211 RepID=A0AAE1BI80_PETCI|nr:hypothetical protein Pcinc_043114 [Petrolisthes cinctipes]
MYEVVCIDSVQCFIVVMDVVDIDRKYAAPGRRQTVWPGRPLSHGRVAEEWPPHKGAPPQQRNQVQPRPALHLPRANLVKPLQSDLQHPIIHHQPPTQPFNDTLDAPPKYEDIFKGGVHCQVPQQQHQEARRSTSFEKKRIKSYLLRHLPKPRTPNDTLNTSTTSSNNTSRRQHQNIVREEAYINRERYYAEINIHIFAPGILFTTLPWSTVPHAPPSSS